MIFSFRVFSYRHLSSLLNVGSVSVCLSVNTVSRPRAFQPRLAPWIDRPDDTTSVVLSLMPRRVVAAAC